MTRNYIIFSTIVALCVSCNDRSAESHKAAEREAQLEIEAKATDARKNRPKIDAKW